MFIVTACNEKQKLSVPENVGITVAGRDMTVAWDSVDNAQGYMIILTGEGCGTADRTINTRKGTVVVTRTGKPASNVEITGETSLKMILMESSEDPEIPMANSVTAKVMSLGGTVSNKKYIDSVYSEAVSKIIDK
jgi:hypothetical protein